MVIKSTMKLTRIPKESITSNAPKCDTFKVPDEYLMQSMLDGHYRRVPQLPSRILDAPGIVEDFYMNALDWSHKNYIGLALGPSVFLYQVESGEVHKLTSRDALSTITSFRFNRDGDLSAVSVLNGIVHIYDVCDYSLLRTFLTNIEYKVCALDWNQNVLVTGNSNGCIQFHDVRLSNHCFGQIPNAHSQIICNARWSHCNRFLASGGNENIVRVWDVRYLCKDLTSASSNFNQVRPRALLTIRAHRAAVKAISWCPWRYNYLMTGGGSADKRLVLTNVSSERQVFQVNTRSQISGIEFSYHYMELITSHGFSSNDMYVWRYERKGPDESRLRKVATLEGHMGRILTMAISPDRQSVATVGGDQRLKFWNCFQSRDEPLVPLRKQETSVCFEKKTRHEEHASPTKRLLFQRLRKMPLNISDEKRKEILRLWSM
ncbi:hypothetical protein ACOME3_008460 [Neoechinorhynchus agilis]